MKPHAPSKPKAIGILDRAALWVFVAGSAAVVAACLWRLAMITGSLLGLVAPDGKPLHDRVVEAGIPPIFDEERGAVVLVGNFQSVGMESPGSAQLAHWGSIVGALTVLAVAILVLLLCVKLLRGRPFTRSMTWLVGGVGLILISGGLIGQMLHAISQASMFQEIEYLARLNDFTVPDPSWTIDLAPVATGIVLAVIAAAFQLGERMQRDTEGLV